MELPFFGHLTRYEWLQFILLYTLQRAFPLNNTMNQIQMIQEK